MVSPRTARSQLGIRLAGIMDSAVPFLNYHDVLL